MGKARRPTLPLEIVTDAANCYNCVRRLDTCVGLVLGELKKAGKEQDTLIIFLGDHGPPLALGKTTCYEAGLRQFLSSCEAGEDFRFAADTQCVGLYFDLFWFHWATQGPHYYALAHSLGIRRPT